MHKITQHTAAVGGWQNRKTMRPADAAGYLSIGLSTFWAFVKKGEIQTTKLGTKTTVVMVDELDRFLASKAAS